MGKFQLPLFGVQARAKRACFFSLHPKDKAKKFSAYAPKAMTHFAAKLLRATEHAGGHAATREAGIGDRVGVCPECQRITAARAAEKEGGR